MARKQETLTFSGALEVQTQKPLDGRRKVTLVADLMDAASFPYIYKGLDVFCEENSKWYTFLGGDQTDISNWREEGSGGGGEAPTLDAVLKEGNTSQEDMTVGNVYAVHPENGNRADVEPAGISVTYLYEGKDKQKNAGIIYDAVYLEHFEKQPNGTYIPVNDFAVNSNGNVDMNDAVKQGFKSALDVPEAYDDTALTARVAANETAIADRYTKAQTDAKVGSRANVVFPNANNSIAVVNGDSIGQSRNSLGLFHYDGSKVTFEGKDEEGTQLFWDEVYNVNGTNALLANKADKNTTYTKAETDAKIAEAMTDVDNEHFHPVAVLPDPADADPTKRPKENHEYVLLEYEQDGTTIKSETHYLFYDGAYHQKETTVSLDGYATEQYVDVELDKKASLEISFISGGGGGDEINAILSQGADQVSVNYYKDTNLPNALNLNVGEDAFSVPTTGYVDEAVGSKQDALVSGTSIKKLENYDLLGSGTINVATVNNESLLGGGNVSTAKILFDVADQTTVLSDTGSDVQIGINKVNSNTLNINEYAPDSRGQSQAIFNMNLPTKDYVDGGLANKQDTLVSGTNIKTVNGDSLLGAGNLVVGQNFEVGVEKWVGTYTEEGVTYQVYNKIIKIAALPSTAGITNYPHGITGIKQILSVYGFCTNGMLMNAPRQNLQDNICIYQVQKGGNIAIEVGKDRSSIGAYVCLVYAKNN